MIDREFIFTLRTVADRVNRENQEKDLIQATKAQEREAIIQRQEQARAQKAIDKIEVGCHQRAAKGFFTYRLLRLSNRTYNPVNGELKKEAKLVKDYCDLYKIPYKIEHEHDGVGLHSNYFFEITWSR